MDGRAEETAKVGPPSVDRLIYSGWTDDITRPGGDGTQAKNRVLNEKDNAIYCLYDIRTNVKTTETFCGGGME